MGQWRIWAIILGVIAISGGVAVVVLLGSVSSVQRDLRAAEDRADSAEEQVGDLSDELDGLKSELARARRSLRATQEEPEPAVDLATALANGTADPDPDLSAYSPPELFTCENRNCSALSQEYVFKNDSQEGSAVTCIFSVDYDNGGTTTFRWASEHVPPGGGTDTVRVFFYGDRPIDYLADPDRCYRGYAP